MQAIELDASISNHRIEIADAALPDQVAQAKVIVMWESSSGQARRRPPEHLAGKGRERGDIVVNGADGDWEALA